VWYTLKDFHPFCDVSILGGFWGDGGGGGGGGGPVFIFYFFIQNEKYVLKKIE
jgi:hypothetical protein